MVKRVLLILTLVFLTSFVSANLNDTLHLNIQTTSGGSVVTGTFDFQFNISMTSDCSAVIFSNSTTQTTDSNGIIDYYIENTGLNYSDQYWLCIYRDGTLTSSDSLSRVPYAFRARNVSVLGVEVDNNFDLGSYNLSTTDSIISANLCNSTNCYTLNDFLTASGTSDNSSWNQTRADELYVPIDASVNATHLNITGTLWSGSGLLNGYTIANWITNAVSNLVNYFTKTEVNSIIETNKTSIFSVADSNYTNLTSYINSQSGDNSSWNQTFAETLYSSHSNLNNAISGNVSLINTDINSAVSGNITNLTSFIVTADNNLTAYINSNSGDNVTWNQTRADELYETLGRNIFDQYLNTTNEVTFDNLTLTDSWFSQQGNLALDLTDDGSDLTLHAGVGGVNSFILDTDGAFFTLIANPGVANGYLLASITETQGSDTQLNFYEGGTGHNRFWDSGSARFGGGESYLCSNLTSDVDCDSSSTGADIVVQDDGWFGGKLFASDWTNVTIAISQLSDLSTIYATADSNYTNLTSFIVSSSGDNASWNQTFANTLYAPVNYGDDWNKTYADTLYSPHSNLNSAISGNISLVNTDINSAVSGNVTTTLTTAYSTADSNYSNLTSFIVSQNSDFTNITSFIVNADNNLTSWVIGLNYITNAVSDLVNYFTRSDVISMISGNASLINTDLDGAISGNISLVNTDINSAISGNVTDLIKATNVAWVNESNTFALNQVFSGNVSITGTNVSYVGCSSYWNGTCEIKTCPTTQWIQC